MVNRKFLIFAALCCAGSANAFYVGASPPPGISFVNGQLLYKANAADISFANGIRQKIGQAAVNVGGKSVAMDAAYKFLPGAGKVLAGAAFGWPGLFLGVAAAVAYDYFKNEGFEVIDGIWQVRTPETIDYKYRYSSADPWVSSIAGVIPQIISHNSGVVGSYSWTECSVYDASTVRFRCKAVMILAPDQTGIPPSYYSNNVYGSKLQYTIPASTRPATQTEMETKMEPLPIPAGAPEGWPMALPPLPVGLPILNPTSEPVPTQQPMRVPQGDPVPVTPATDPATWKTPVIDITPSPTIAEPWRVDIQTKDIVTTNSTPLSSGPVPVSSDPNTSEKPTEATPGLCDLYPDILACKKLDEVPDENLPEINRQVTITPESGWGGAGSCPQSKTITVQGHTIPIPLDLICQYMQGLRPIIIAMAWLSAGFILVGARGGD